jgi:hypothetical protein
MIPVEILKSYKQADDSFVINIGHPNGKEPDPSLVPIRISLPKPPKLSLIDGYGLPPEEQYWRKPIMPEKFVQLEKEVNKYLKDTLKKDERLTGYRILDEIWKRIQDQPEYYEKEIKFIRQQWWHRIYGYWFFNNGKPVYHYYLSWWKIEGRLYPEYRDRDRKAFLFRLYLKETKETFKYYDDHGVAEVNENGEYEMIEMPTRTFYGSSEPKNRRQGITNQVQSAQCETTSRNLGDLAVIFSTGFASASSLFKGKTIKSWTKLPFFFLPTWDGYFDQGSEINFKKPKHVVLGDELNSTITYADSAMGIEYDGQRITFSIFDESGKTKECDVTERWDVHKQGMSTGDGADIIGFCIHPSTVEDMDSSGGAHYQNLVYASNFYKRNPVTGQTISGLATMFFPAYEGLEGFVGKYGESIIDDPTEQQIKNGFKYKNGSKKHLQSNRDQLLHSKDPKDKVKYRRLVVKQPFTLDECFKLTVGGSNVNIEIIDTRIAELRRMREPFVRGNFEWIDNVFGGGVWFMACPNGRWEVSKQLNPGEQNLKTLTYIFDEFTGDRKEIWRPLFPNRFTIGSDPTDYRGNKNLAITTGSYMSDAGITVYWERDRILDPGDNCYDWESGRFAAVYRNNVSSIIYDEDLLKVAIYYGGMIYPETNKGDVNKYLTVEHNYDGYLIYDWDENTKKFKIKPGIYQAEKSKQDISDLYRNYIDLRGHKECHISLLMEIAKAKTFDDFTKLDMYVAGGCALLGSKSRTRQMLETVDTISDDFEQLWRDGRLGL